MANHLEVKELAQQRLESFVGQKGLRLADVECVKQLRMLCEVAELLEKDVTFTPDAVIVPFNGFHEGFHQWRTLREKLRAYIDFGNEWLAR